MGIEAGGDDDEKVALPSFGGSTAHARPPLPSNPALTLQRGLGSAGSAGAGQGQPRPGGLMRKESFGVPKIKNHKELLKGVFQKKGLPPGLSSLNEQQAFHSDSKNTVSFPGANVPSMKSFEQLSWRDYFTDKKSVTLEDRGGMTFNMYTAGVAGDNRPLLFCIHGGGYTGLTWALLAKKLSDKYSIAALDLRSHGESTSSEDFSIEEMTKDVTCVWQRCFGESKPKTVLLGHSLGGAIAIQASSLEQIPSLAATIVIDVVEGTALQSLPYMQQVINKRPKSFTSVEDFVNYAYTSGLTKNFEAARVSAASQVKGDKPENPSSFVWVTDLTKTASYWNSWYKGMSSKFLKVPVPKLLLLAGTDRLDKELTIGQMQGKFQMKVLPAGHAIHEDEPEKTSNCVADFLSRFQIS